jgi:hypothetical protein
MSEIASVVERTRKAFASVSQLEAAILRAPNDRALQLNLSAMRKMASQSQEQFFAYSRNAYLDLCNYRLVPASGNRGYSLQYVSLSLLGYQNLFTQIYDALKNGIKQNARYGKEAEEESALEFAYSYSGSLGVILFSHSERNLLSGKLDSAIDSLYETIEINSRQAVRQVASRLGNAVVKRVYDWSDVNLKGGFAADVRWNRSDGRQLGEVVERDRMEEIIQVIDATSDSKTKEIEAIGILFGGNIGSRSFHFVVPNGEVYRGHLVEGFDQTTEMTLGKWYRARILETEKFHYATEKVERDLKLLNLEPASSLPFEVGNEPS